MSPKLHTCTYYIEFVAKIYDKKKKHFIFKKKIFFRRSDKTFCLYER